MITMVVRHNGSILTGTTIRDALADDTDRPIPGLISTAPAQAALWLAREAAPEQALTVHRTLSRARTALRRRLIARLIG